MKQELKAGGVFDFATPDEVEERLNIITRQSAQERARGVEIWRGVGSGDVSGAAVTIPATGSNETIGIDPGWAVLVQSVRAFGLGTNDVIQIFRGVAAGVGFVGQITAAAPAGSFGGKGLILKGGEYLIFTGASLTATGTITVNCEGIMVPETDVYKLLT